MGACSDWSSGRYSGDWWTLNRSPNDYMINVIAWYEMIRVSECISSPFFLFFWSLSLSLLYHYHYLFNLWIGSIDGGVSIDSVLLSLSLSISLSFWYIFNFCHFWCRFVKLSVDPMFPSPLSSSVPLYIICVSIFTVWICMIFMRVRDILHSLPTCDVLLGLLGEWGCPKCSYWSFGLSI